jgi:phospholipase/carboxylesterase
VTLRCAERPAAREPAGALVFLHGYGGKRDFLPLLDALDPDRRFHGYLPRGPLDLGEGQAQWIELNAPWRAPEQLAPTWAWLDSLPFARGRTVLGGFSQGAAVACLLALAAGHPRPAALLCLGGSLPLHCVDLDLEPPFPRVAIAHGSDDDAVPVASARNTRKVLESVGADVLYLETAIGHEPDPAVIPDLRAFLAEVGR